MSGEERVHVGARVSAGEFHESGAGDGSDLPLARAQKRRAAEASPADQVAAILQGYADRAIFRGYSRGSTRAGKTTFKMVWHKGQAFELILDTKARTLTFPVVLPKVPAKSEMYRDFRRWLAEQQSEERPPHRRVDPAKAKLSCGNRCGNVWVTLTSRDRDWEYATRRLVNVIHEVFLGFVADGYFDWMIETFELDPDRP